MGTLPEHFNELLISIEPIDERQALAQDIPSKVRDFLKTSDKIQTIEPHSRLAGSYARHTAINDIKDVDIILFVDKSYKDHPIKDLLSAVFSAVGKLPEYLNDTGNINLPEYFTIGNGSMRRRQRRSVHIDLKHLELKLDIVPVIAPNGSNQILEVPDREWDIWVETHPLGYGNELSNLNSKHQGKIIPLIKLLKFWRDVHMIYRRPKSYWLESIVYEQIISKAFEIKGKSYAEMFSNLLRAIECQFSSCLEDGKSVPNIPDPMLGHNVAHNWERDDFKAFMTRIGESRGWAQRAMEKDDEKTSVELWQRVFGIEKFPGSYEEIEGRRLRRALLAEMTTVTSQGKVLLLQTPSQSSIKVPSQRFYGEDN